MQVHSHLPGLASAGLVGAAGAQEACKDSVPWHSAWRQPHFFFQALDRSADCRQERVPRGQSASKSYRRAHLRMGVAGVFSVRAPERTRLHTSASANRSP